MPIRTTKNREASVQQSGKKALAIRKGKWKLIVHGDNKRELFDLNADIGEKYNLIETNPEVATELALLLQSYLDKGRSTPGKAQPLEYKISHAIIKSEFLRRSLFSPEPTLNPNRNPKTLQNSIGIVPKRVAFVLGTEPNEHRTPFSVEIQLSH